MCCMAKGGHRQASRRSPFLRAKPMNGKRIVNTIVAVVAIQFFASGQTEAATAHCLGRIQDTAGHVVADLGTVAAYNAVFPQNGAHQDQCVADVSAAATSLLRNTGQMCHTFFAASSS